MGHNNVHDIMTFKSGKFYFSYLYDFNKISKYLLESNILYTTINELPILPNLSSSLEEEIIKRSIFGTAAIEGNPLSVEKVSKIIEDKDSNLLKIKAEREIHNLKKTYEFVKKFDNQLDLILTEKMVKQIHNLITKDIEYNGNISGKYRNHLVKVGDSMHGGIYTPPKIIKDIKNLMNEYITWINTESILKLDPFLRSALAHYHFALIHPFGDGNGRTARIIEAVLLRSSGIKYVPIMLSNYYYQNIDDYYWAFSNSEKNKQHDVTDFLEFVLKGVIESLNTIKSRIIFFIRKFTLKDFYLFLKKEKRISQRQQDLLNLLIDNFEQTSMNVKDLISKDPFNILYRNVTERTARRDLKRLIELDLISEQENNTCRINLRHLG